MRYTQQFWYGVRCALLVLWGTPYCRRYGAGAYRQRGCRFIAGGSCLVASESQFSSSVMVVEVFKENIQLWFLYATARLSLLDGFFTKPIASCIHLNLSSFSSGRGLAASKPLFSNSVMVLNVYNKNNPCWFQSAARSIAVLYSRYFFLKHRFTMLVKSRSFSNNL